MSDEHKLKEFLYNDSLVNDIDNSKKWNSDGKVAVVKVFEDVVKSNVGKQDDNKKKLQALINLIYVSLDLANWKPKVDDRIGMNGQPGALGDAIDELKSYIASLKKLDINNWKPKVDDRIGMNGQPGALGNAIDELKDRFESYAKKTDENLDNLWGAIKDLRTRVKKLEDK